MITHPYNTTNVVIDWETLDVRPSAVVISLGYAILGYREEDGETGIVEAGHYNINAHPQTGRTVGVDTLSWWADTHKRYPQLAGLLALDSKQLGVVMEEFCGVLRRLPKNYVIWGYGAVFDLGILEDICRSLDVQLPNWNFRRGACLRTLTQAYPHIQAPSPNEYPHLAVSDAMYEAKWLAAILKEVIR